MKQHIPNAITSFNLVFGCISILAAFKGELELAALCIGAAAVMDFFDGFAARLLKVSGEMGKQLDSLADMISFGAAPAFIFYGLGDACFTPYCVHRYTFLLIPVFSALRLAKFNIDTRQSDSFIGVPTPANAMFIASLPLMLSYNGPWAQEIITNTWFLTLFPILSAFMLVAELPLLALKFKHFRFKGNEARFILILSSVISITLFKFAGVPLSIILYIVISVFNNIINKKNTHEI